MEPKPQFLRVRRSAYFPPTPGWPNTYAEIPEARRPLTASQVGITTGYLNHVPVQIFDDTCARPVNENMIASGHFPGFEFQQLTDWKKPWSRLRTIGHAVWLAVTQKTARQKPKEVALAAKIVPCSVLSEMSKPSDYNPEDTAYGSQAEQVRTSLFVERDLSLSQY